MVSVLHRRPPDPCHWSRRCSGLQGPAVRSARIGHMWMYRCANQLPVPSWAACFLCPRVLLMHNSVAILVCIWMVEESESYHGI